MSDLIIPENTYALLIGIDNYAAGSEWTLPNPVSECIQFANWLKGKNVPPTQIVILAKTDNSSLAAELNRLKGEGVIVEDASLIEIGNHLNSSSFELSGKTPGDCLLYFYWSGHGVTTDDHFQYLICNEAQVDNPRVFNLEDIRTKLRGGDWAKFENQAFLVNACATYDDKTFSKVLIPQPLPANAANGSKARQFAVCAASPEQAARADENAFFAVLLQGLRTLTSDSLLPDPKELHTNIGIGYKNLPVEKYGDLPDPRGYFDLWSNEKLSVISLGSADGEDTKLMDLIYGKLIELRRSLTHYRKIYCEMVKLAKEIKSTASIIRDLCECGNSQYVELPQYVEYFERVAASEQNTLELQQWLEPYVNDVPALLELREKIKETDKLPQTCFLYFFVPNTPPFQLTYKLVDANGRLISTKDSLENKLLLSELTASTICQAVCSVLNEDDDVLDHITDIHIELFLPRNLLDFSADQHNDPHDSASTLEETYAVRLRWRERAEGMAKAPSKKWSDLGKIIHTENILNQQIEWFTSVRSNADLSHTRWIEQAKTKAYVGLQFNPLRTNNAPHILFGQALDQGIPYLIWPRFQCECPVSFCEEVDKAINGITFEKSLEGLQQIRRVTDKPPDHPGRHLSIFWDDPRRNPFRYDSKTMSAHQGTTPKLTNII